MVETYVLFPSKPTNKYEKNILEHSPPMPIEGYYFGILENKSEFFWYFSSYPTKLYICAAFFSHKDICRAHLKAILFGLIFCM